MGQSDAAIRRRWQEWVDSDRFQRHDGSSRPRVKADREDILIVRTAVTAGDSSLSIIRRATRTRVSTITIHRRLIERNVRSYHHCITYHSRLHTVELHYSGAWLYKPVFAIARRTGPQIGVMVWGAIMFVSRTPLIVPSDSPTAQWYADDILRTVLLPFLLQYPCLFFQQDNAIPHTARGALKCLKACQALPLPARSPDLSPIEHAWGMFGRILVTCPDNWSKFGKNIAGDHQGALLLYVTPCDSLHPG
ncbi:transposable element Tcb2 transposase [Trichonephila clavipes]|nr:transposable element Tcb2 transposase [Trichonephila clavipes]